MSPTIERLRRQVLVRDAYLDGASPEVIAAALDATPETVRRDLRDLADAGLVVWPVRAHLTAVAIIPAARESRS